MAWPILQLQRMTRYMPDRVEEAMNRLFELDPGLRNDLVIGAVDQEMLSMEQAAEFTCMSVDEIEQRLMEFRTQMAYREVRIESSGTGPAKLVGTGISVWEIVRELRRLGSESAISKSFPSLSKHEITVALRYASEHESEMEEQIRNYEAVVQRRQNEYPYAK
ncbi:MAG: DUF433 domain-containing protein [Armatimonadetes bacterium]|nr:DUF433 domain-containing protein [Armatimonadota bacterium]